MSPSSRRSRRNSPRKPRRRINTRSTLSRRRKDGKIKDTSVTRSRHRSGKKIKMNSARRVRMMLPSNGRSNFSPTATMRFDDSGILTALSSMRISK